MSQSISHSISRTCLAQEFGLVLVVSDTGPFWLQGHRTTQTAHCAMRNTIAAEMNHSRAFRGRTETKQKSFHLRDVQHELQLGHWRMVCIWKTSSLSSRFVLTSCLLYRCDMGVDSNGCWLGNYCQDINAGDVTFVWLDLYFDEILSQAAALSWLRGVPWRSWERLQPGLTGLPPDLDTVLLDLDTVPLDRGTPLVLALTRRYVGTKCSSWFLFFCWTRKQ